MKKIVTALFLSLLVLLRPIPSWGGDILKASPGTGTPLALTLSWECPQGTTQAEAGGNSKNWQGPKEVKGQVPFSGIRAPTTYTIKCSSKDTVATVITVSPGPVKDGELVVPATGYRLYWSTTEGQWINVIDVPGSNGGDITVQGLPEGTIYFAAKAYSLGNQDSPLSNVVSKTVSKGFVVEDKVDIGGPAAPVISVKQ